MANSNDTYGKQEELDEDRSMTQGQRKQGQYQGQEDEDRSQQQVHRPRYKYRRGGGEQGSDDGHRRRRRKSGRDRSNSRSSSSSSNTTGPTDSVSRSPRSGGPKDDEQDLTSGTSSDTSLWPTRQQRSTTPTRTTRTMMNEQNSQATAPVEAEQTPEKQLVEPANETTQSRSPALREQDSEGRRHESQQPQEEHGVSSSVASAPSNTAPAAPSRPTRRTLFGHSTAAPVPLTAVQRRGQPSSAPSDRRVFVRQSDNKGPDSTATLQPLAGADPEESWLGTNGDPDVLLSVPNLDVEDLKVQPQEEHQASFTAAPAPSAPQALPPAKRTHFGHPTSAPIPPTAAHLRGRPDSSARVVRQSDNKGPDTTATLQPLAEADPEMWLGTNGDPDVLLSVPNLGVDRIYLDVQDLNAHVDLHAKVLDLLELHVGADVGIKKVELEIDNVRVQAMLKVRLNEVEKIIGRVVDLLEHHPEILGNLTGGLGRGLEAALAPDRPPPLAVANPPTTSITTSPPRPA